MKPSTENMKTILNVFLLITCNVLFAQTNLLDTSPWTVGSGSVSGFVRYGVDTENIRALGTAPNGAQEVLWTAVPDASNGNANGGWYSDLITIDPTKTYRYTVWVKKTGSNDGTTRFGFISEDTAGSDTSLALDGTAISFPNFFSGDLPQLDKWYLLAGFVHTSNYVGTTSIGGIYDPDTGNLVVNITDFKFGPSAARTKHKSILYGPNNTADRQYFYAPTLYEVNGSEPTIQTLLGTGDTQDPTAPTLSSTGKTDTTVDLSWSGATDNTAVTGYKVFKDAVLETTLGAVSNYQVTGLTASTAYQFTVTALDAANNESAASNALSVTTNAASGGGSGNWTLNGSDLNYTAGNVAIGTTTIPADYKLAVDGKIISEEVKVQLQSQWPDYVFNDDYSLPTLQEVQDHIEEHGHLPNIPSAAVVKANGIELGEMNRLLLEKIEELTLYILKLEEEIKTLKSKNNDIAELKKTMTEQHLRLGHLEKKNSLKTKNP